MTTLLREDNRKKAERIQSVENVYNWFNALLHRTKAKIKYVDTRYGKVRTLWYGDDINEKTSIYFDLHGGGFVLGSPEMDEHMNLQFNKEVGCKVISIDYAKAPEYPYPYAVNQIYETIKEIYNKADKYGIDGNKMAIGGHSAGANLSTVMCMKAKAEGTFDFKCQILDYPPLDLATSSYNKPQPKGCIPPKMAAMFDACYIDADQAKESFASPVYATEKEIKGIPPALLILAGQDSLHDEGIRYWHLLENNGISVMCYEYQNALHGFTLKNSDNTKDAVKKIALFLNKYIG